MYLCVYTFSDLFTPKVNIRCNKIGKEHKRRKDKYKSRSKPKSIETKTVLIQQPAQNKRMANRQTLIYIMFFIYIKRTDHRKMK